MAFIPSPTWTSTMIATAALSMVGAASVDNPASAEDLALAITRLDAINQDMSARGVFYQADLDATPTPIALWYAKALALNLKPDFGDRTPIGQDAIPPMEMIDRALRRIGAETPSYGPQQVSFF